MISQNPYRFFKNPYRFRFFRFFDTSSHLQKNIIFLYMNNINDMTNKQLNKTPWSDDDDDDDDVMMMS